MRFRQWVYRAFFLATVLVLLGACGLEAEVDDQVTDRLVALDREEKIALTDLVGECESVTFVGAFTSDDTFRDLVGERVSTSMRRREDVTALVVSTPGVDQPQIVLVPRVPVDLDELGGQTGECGTHAIERQDWRGALVRVDPQDA